MTKRVSMFYKALLFCSSFAIVPTAFAAAAAAGQAAPMELKEVDAIRREMNKYTRVVAEAKDQAITVFIGNTGVGKSTLINLAADIAMQADDNDHIVVDEARVPHGRIFAPIGEGLHSVTHCPEHFYSELMGHMYDLPGFLDTEGTVQNILNASAIHSLLSNARSVRVAFITSQAELEAARGETLRELDRAVAMFDDQFLGSDSCMVIINQIINRKIIALSREAHIAHIAGLLKKRDLPSQLPNMDKINNKVLLSRARSDDGQQFFNELRQSVIDAVLAIRQRPVGGLNMSKTLNLGAKADITAFFKECMKELQKASGPARVNRTVAEITEEIKEGKVAGPVSAEFKKYRENLWEEFQRLFIETQEYQLLHVLCAEPYSTALDAFAPSFQHDFISAFNYLVITEKE
ncbi:MAG: hypothetical protein WCG04_06455, partial [Alphaproteobacteria bacterium]